MLLRDVSEVLIKYGELSHNAIQAWNHDDNMTFLLDLRFVLGCISNNNKRSDLTAPRVIRIPMDDYAARFPSQTTVYDSIAGCPVEVQNPTVEQLRYMAPNSYKLQEVQQNPTRLKDQFLFQGVAHGNVIMHEENPKKVYAAARIPRTVCDNLNFMCTLQTKYKACTRARKELEEARIKCICAR